MKFTVLTFLALILPATAFCGSFAQECQKINSVTNRYVNLGNIQTCHMAGMPYQYPLTDFITLNTACESEAAGSYAKVLAQNLIDVKSRKESVVLSVTCWNLH